MTKNLGTGVSGYLDPEGRSWETTVFQSSKPILDKELNLGQDTEQDMERRFRKRAMPSGWLAADFLDTADNTSGIFLVSAVVDELSAYEVVRRRTLIFTRPAFDRLVRGPAKDAADE